MKKIIACILIVLPSLISSWAASAETTRYVSDDLEITLRAGQGVKFSIIKMLSSGSKLDVLETDPAGYSKVRTVDDTTGWVLTRFLSNTPSSRVRLAISEQKVANLQLKLATYKEEIQVLSTQNSDVASELISLKATSQRLSKELNDLRNTASNAVALDNENRQLKEKMQQSEHKIQSLVIENNALQNSETKSWFLIGAAVLFGGIILGLVLPHLRLQKKSSYVDF